MGKVRGNPEGSTKIHRTPFVGDPAMIPFSPDLDGKTTPRHKRDGYKERLEARKRQSSPVAPTKPYRKGPSKRAPGMAQEAWRKMLAGG